MSFDWDAWHAANRERSRAAVEGHRQHWESYRDTVTPPTYGECVAGLPRTMNQKEAVALLVANGWTREVGGNHQTKMTKAGHRPITLPEHKRRDYSVGFTAAILRQAGLKGPTENDEG